MNVAIEKLPGLRAVTIGIGANLLDGKFRQWWSAELFGDGLFGFGNRQGVEEVSVLIADITRRKLRVRLQAEQDHLADGVDRTFWRLKRWRIAQYARQQECRRKECDALFV